MQNSAGTVNALRKLGFNVLTVTAAEGLESETACHTDMLVHVSTDKTVFVHSSQTELINELQSRGIKTQVLTHVFGRYPDDVAFNVACLGKYGVGKKSAVHTAIAGIYGENFIDVKQGYAKCSISPVGENAVITEDTGIANDLKNKGFSVLEISKGDVYLSEKHYGFFGGATGRPDNMTLLINGELKTHRDAEKIRNFLDLHGVTPVELKKGQITDIGSILFV